MTEEEQRLMARLLLGLLTTIDPLAPFQTWGVEVGRCRYCGVVGEIHYCSEIEYKHGPGCLLVLAEQLRKSIAEEKA